MKKARMLVKLTATAAVLAASLVASAGPAAAYDGIQPTFRSENVYFHCGTTKAHQVNLVADGTPSWNTTAPSSVTGGTGCGAFDPGVERGANQETIYDAQFAGTFTGNLRDLTLHLHQVVPGQVRGGSSVRVWITIDGQDVTGGGSAGKIVNVTPVAGNSGATQDYEISLWNIGFANYTYDAAGNVIDVKTGGLATEDGDGEIEHSLLISIDSATATQNSIWAYDTSEVPSGITFNPATLAAAKIKGVLPTTEA